MAWPTRSKLLAINRKANPVGSTPWLLGGPAVGKTWLVKSCSFFNQASTTKTIYLSIKRGGTSFYVAQAICGTLGVQVDPHTRVLEYGDELWAETSTTVAGNIDIAVHGALLG
jgi:hypothetical protein